ncbi:MAG TPA: carboxypeptidase regulatory-like domain-containing protein, partial [Pyrinomonadaceae bacterium]|nr:carboxypeptidase regulatory-like domain-containing protein [Pyrinomonadaceae bacterium]
LQFSSIGGTADLVTQPDGKIVLIGSCFSINFGNFPFCLLRLNQNGGFDTTFAGPQGNTGYVLTSIPGYTPGEGLGIARQSSGKLVVVGYGNNVSNDRYVIARFNENGSLDTTFGQSGFVINTEIIGRANKVLIQPDGKILIVGTGSGKLFVARYSADGVADISFGSNGIFLLNTASDGSAIALQPDGKIIAAGDMSSSATYLLIRLNSNGTLDNAWDGDGITTVPSVAFQNGNIAVAIQGDGRILAVADESLLFRFTNDGSLDTSFDNDGSRPALDGIATANDLTVTASGKITVVGHSKIPNLSTFSDPILYKTARFLPSGEPDPTYSDDGFLDIDVIASVRDGAFASTYDLSGRLVISGRSAPGARFSPWNGSQFSLVRLLASPTQNVGFTGRVLNSAGKPLGNAFITLKFDNDTVATTRTNNFGYFRFRDVQSARTYTFSVRAKNLNFYDQNILIDGEVANYLFVGFNQ